MYNLPYLLEFNSIDDKGAEAIAINLKYIPTLRVLNLCEIYSIIA